MDSNSDLTNFMFFLIYMATNCEEAMTHLLKVPVSNRPDMYIQAADEVFKVNRKDLLKTILKQVMSVELDWGLSEYCDNILILLRYILILT